MKRIIISILILALIVGAVFAIFSSWKSGASDFKNASYILEGRTVKLADGSAEETGAPGSSSKIITRYFGNDLRTDLNGDGREDVVFLLTQSTGGSGTFYYAVAAINTKNGYVGTAGYLLGDRIAPQATQAGDTGVIITFADRAQGEPMAARPSVAKSVNLKFDGQNNSLVVVPAVQRISLSGTYLCLPHTDSSGPQTLECALGLKTQDGTYYALDFNFLSQGVPDIATGSMISATGNLTPTEFLSSDTWRKYPIKGIFSVTDSLKVIK